MKRILLIILFVFQSSFAVNRTELVKPGLQSMAIVLLADKPCVGSAGNKSGSEECDNLPNKVMEFSFYDAGTILLITVLLSLLVIEYLKRHEKKPW